MTDLTAPTTEDYLLAQQELQDLRVRIVNKDPTVTAAQMAQVILNLRRGRMADPAMKAGAKRASRAKAKTTGPDVSQISILDLMERPVDK